jgi:c-di-GMP-binding flagellar brake protein YcgR
MDGAERRQFPRLRLDVPVTLVVPGQGRPLRGQIKDISQGGCFFTATAAPAVSREGRVSMDFVVLPRAICNATGRVVRDAEDEQSGSAGFGVEFGAVNSEMQKFVDELEAASPERRAEYLARILDPEIYVS